MEETKINSLYSKENLSNFRKSIQNMGDTVPNGNVEMFDALTKRSNIRDKVSIDMILRTPLDDISLWRKFSRLYYSYPLYRRLIDYFANILYNDYIISPLFNTSKMPNNKKIMADYNSVLRVLDEDIKPETFATRVLTDLLLEGQAYYYIDEKKKGGTYYYKTIKLPTDYCKIIGTAGTPAINIFAIDLTFIDTAMAKLTKDNLLSREEVLRQYPSALRAAYNKYKKGKNVNKWFIVPVENGIAFSTYDGRPPFCLLIKELARIDKFEILRDDYIATNLTKLLVQIIDIDKEGNPEIDLELAAEFHKNLKLVASKKANVDALTTLAKEIDVLSLGETGDATKNYEFLQTYYDQFYDDAGVSAELFNSTTAGTLAESQNRDEAYVLHLRRQIANWFNYFLSSVCYKKVCKNVKFGFSYLDTSYKNREEMIGSYLEGATYGFSKIVPQVALGVKQRYIESMTKFENEILDLGAKLVPLQSSHTISSKNDGTDSADSKTANKEAQKASEEINGRPTKDASEKKDSTITKDASL